MVLCFLFVEDSCHIDVFFNNAKWSLDCLNRFSQPCPLVMVREDRQFSPLSAPDHLLNAPTEVSILRWWQFPVSSAVLPRKSMGFVVLPTRGWIFLVLWLWGIYLNVSETELPHLYNRDNNTYLLQRLLMFYFYSWAQ